MNTASLRRTHASITSRLRQTGPAHGHSEQQPRVRQTPNVRGRFEDGFDRSQRPSLLHRTGALQPAMPRIDAERTQGAPVPQPRAAPMTSPYVDPSRSTQAPAAEQVRRGLTGLGSIPAADTNTAPGTPALQAEAALKSLQSAGNLPTTSSQGCVPRDVMTNALPGRSSPVTTPATGVPSSSTLDATGSEGLDGGVGSPSGPIQTIGDGTDWSAINQWDPIINSAAQEFGVPADLLKAMMVIESRGNPDAYRASDGCDDVPAVGLMQVKPGYWNHLVPDADPYTPEGNVRLAAAILRQAYDQHGSWDAAITQVYFPASDVNGTSQREYLELVHGLQKEIQSA